MSNYKWDTNKDTALSILHPLLFNDENLAYAKQVIKQPALVNHTQPDKAFVKENLEQITEHRWLKKCETILFQPEENETQEQAINRLYDTLSSEASVISDEVCLKEPKSIIALDLETTGLNRKFKVVGGRNLLFNEIVGVCLATSSNKGYYIPTKHNGTDNNINFEINLILPFIQKLIDNYHIIYHNSVFDQEVLAIHGVNISNNNHTFTDTMLLANLIGWKQRLRQVGLKFLSAEILNRKMLEIHEITGNKDYVRMQDIPASNAYVYGCSDAINTYGLFEYITQSNESPYNTQKNRTLLEHKVVASVRSMFRCGLPLDYETAVKTLRTVVRRIIMLENIFYDSVSDESVEINSAEKVGTHIYKLLKEQFENKYCPGHILHKGEKGFDVLTKKLEQDFHLQVKVSELKAGTKISANLPEDTLWYLYNKLEVWDFIEDAIKDEIWTICEVLQEYRSLQQRINIIVSMVRDCFNDDLNLNRVPIELKLSGTDTGRFSNSGSRNGAFNHIGIHYMKTKTKAEIVEGGGSSSFNAQGLSHDTGRNKKLKRVKNINQLSKNICNANTEFDKMITSYIYDTLIGG